LVEGTVLVGEGEVVTEAVLLGEAVLEAVGLALPLVRELVLLLDAVEMELLTLPVVELEPDDVLGETVEVVKVDETKELDAPEERDALGVADETAELVTVLAMENWTLKLESEPSSISRL